MDIMDSTDTPTGGLDGSTASSTGALPLSVDERDDFATSPTNTDRMGGTRATSTLSGDDGPSTSSSTIGSNGIDDSLPNALPTSTDDLMMPTQEYATHPSVLSQDSSTVFSTSSPTSSASASMDSAKASARSAASDVKAKASSMADSAKSGASSMMSSLSSTLHSAEDKAEAAYTDLKADVQSHLPSHTTTEPTEPKQTTGLIESTDTHPLASSMHDAHLHPGMVSLPTHENEIHPPASSSTPHVSTAHQRGLDAAAASHHEPKDASAGGVMGALSSLHQKLEDGVEAVKDKVDGWAERNLRSSPKQGEHLSEAHVKDLPTLVDPSNDKNTDNIRARMHSSNERAGAAALVQDNSV